MVIIVGHRGAGKNAPENTLLAFRTAIKLGLERAELDVRLTKDKQVIVIHDAEVDRVTNGKGQVKDLTLRQIKKLRCFSNQQIPTLQEVIDAGKGKITLQIELKDLGKPFNPQLASAVYNLIVKNKIHQEVWVTSFSADLLQEIRRKEARLTLGYLYSQTPQNLWTMVRRLNLNYLCPRYDLVTKELIAKAHKKKIKVYAWRVNAKEVGEKLIRWGIDALGTDYPELFLG